MTRKLSNWLDSFKEWTLPRSEVMESLIIWAGLFSIAAALRRRIWIPKESGLGSWEVFPYIYLMFIANPGMRKTTTLNYALELFDGIPDLTSGPSAASQAALSERLSKSSDTSLYLISEEFSDLLLKSGNEMYEFLTSVFDGRKKFETNTMIRGVEFLENPCINFAAGSTPIWISENMPASAIGGGFASRVIFIYENKLRRKKLFHDDINYEALEELKLSLQDDLRHISKELAGPFTLSKEVKDYAEALYQGFKPEAAHPKVQGYYQRKHVHMLKIAMLLHVSYSDELILTIKDIDDAITILEETVERNLQMVFEGIGKNVYTFDLRDITKYLTEKGPTKRKDLLSQFRSVATPSMLSELLSGLIAMGDIKVSIDEENETVYTT
jgi:hypothetical protein